MTVTDTDSNLQDASGVASGATIAFLGQTAFSVVSFVYGIVLARAIGSAGIGLYFLGLAGLQLAAAISCMGLELGLTRYVALLKATDRESDIAGVVRFALMVGVAIGCLLGGAMFISGPIISAFIEQEGLTDILRIFAFMFPFSAAGAIILGALRGLKMMKQWVYAHDLAEPLVRLGAFILLAAAGWKVFGAVIAHAISVVASTLLAFYFLNRVIPMAGPSPTSRDLVRRSEIMRFSLPLLPANLSNRLRASGTIWILGFLALPEAVGLYNVALRTALLGTIVLNSFNAIFGPTLSELYARRRLSELDRLFKTVTRWTFSLSMPIYLLMILLAKPIVSMYGKEFTGASTSLVVLSLGMIIHSGVGAVGMMIIMSGRSKIWFCNMVGVSAANLLLAFALIPRYGALGAAFACAISIVSLNIISLWQVYRFLHVQPYTAKYIKPVVAALLSSMAVVCVSRMAHASGFPYILMGACIFAVIYTGVGFFLRLEQEDIAVLASVSPFKRNFRSHHGS